MAQNSTVINGYRLITPLSSDKSGFGRWCFAEKNGRVVFLKEFLSPVYPVDEAAFTEEQLLRRRKVCMEFQDRKLALYRQLLKCQGGNVVCVEDFFRFRSKYYIVTEKIEDESIPPERVWQMNIYQRMLLSKVLCDAVGELHRYGIVHADIKPNNILLKRTRAGMFTAKLIDFDSSFFASAEVDPESLQGDQVYLAPESFLRMAGEDVRLTQAVDIFALGVLFYQYFTGTTPVFSRKADYSFEAVLEGYELQFPPGVPKPVAWLIAQMLKQDPRLRPSAFYLRKQLELIENTVDLRQFDYSGGR